MSDQLILPHGGKLVNRFPNSALREELFSKLPHLRVKYLDETELADLKLIAVGAYSPLTGFLTREDYSSVLQHMRLSTGTVWPLPITLSADFEFARLTRPGEYIALAAADGNIYGVLKVQDVFEANQKTEAQLVFGTQDENHPGVAYLYSRQEFYLGGEVWLLQVPPARYPRYELTPMETRTVFAHRGWATITGFQTRNPAHRAHEYIQKCALEITDALLIHPLVGPTKEDDFPPDLRLQAYQTLVANYFPPDRAVLAAFPSAMRYAGPREALFHALVRKNYGCTHFIVGRDHAGAGKWYPPYAAQEIFRQFNHKEIGITPLFFSEVFYCHRCLSYVSPKTCPHPPAERLSVSGTELRAALKDGRHLPPEVVRPELARIFAPQSPPRPSHKNSLRGPIVWLTGLSGSGKSTLANLVAAELKKQGHPVQILDGDELRANLNTDLTFSKADRLAHMKRTAYVAGLLANHGITVIMALISPYRDARTELKASLPNCIEVYVDCPLEVCQARDVKGLYRKALRGEIPGFTGISDPYEEPVNPELVVHTHEETPEESAGKILAYLNERFFGP